MSLHRIIICLLTIVAYFFFFLRIIVKEFKNVYIYLNTAEIYKKIFTRNMFTKNTQKNNIRNMREKINCCFFAGLRKIRK